MDISYSNSKTFKYGKIDIGRYSKIKLCDNYIYY